MHYVYPNLGAAQDALSVINSWAPVVGLRNGKPAPECQQTTCWIGAPLEMLSGEYAIPQITESVLATGGGLVEVDVTDEDGNTSTIWQYEPVDDASRADFMTNHGQDMRELTSEDFIVIEEE